MLKMVTQILKKLSRSGCSDDSERQENSNSQSLISGAGRRDMHSRAGGEFRSGFDTSSINRPAMNFPGASSSWGNNAASCFHGFTGIHSGSESGCDYFQGMSSARNQNQKGNNEPTYRDSVTIPVSTSRFCTPATGRAANTSHTFVNNIMQRQTSGINPFLFPGTKISNSQGDVTRTNNINVNPLQRGMEMVMGVRGAVETLTKKFDLDTSTTTTSTTTMTTSSKDEKMPTVPAQAPAPDSMTFHGYAPTKRTKKVAKRGKRHNLLRKMSETLSESTQTTEMNSLSTIPQDKCNTNRGIVGQGHRPYDKNNEEPHITTTSKRIPESSSIRETGDTRKRFEHHQNEHMNPSSNSSSRSNGSSNKKVTVEKDASARGDEERHVSGVSAKKRKARSTWSLAMGNTNAKNVNSSSPPNVNSLDEGEAKRKGRKKMKTSADTSDEAQDHGEKEEGVFDTALTTTTDENSSLPHNQVDSIKICSPSDTITNALIRNRGVHAQSQKDDAIECSLKQPPEEAQYQRPETKLTCDEEIKKVVEYASSLVANVLRSRTFLSFIQNRKATDLVDEDNTKAGDSNAGPSHASSSAPAPSQGVVACDSIGLNVDTIKTAVRSHADSRNFLILSSLAVQRFAVDVFYPYLLASKKSMGNKTPRSDRVLLSTFLALREMLITNADQLLNLQEIMRSAIIQSPGKASVFHQAGNVHNGIVGIDSCSFVARNVASMIIRLAAQKVDRHQQGSKFYENFVAAANNYDMHSDDFRFCLRHADARSLCVLPNGKVLGEEESRIAKTSFNLARSYHPLIYYEQQEQEICLSSDENSDEAVEKVEAKNKLVLPRANAFVTFVMVENSTHLQPREKFTDLELVGNQDEALDSYNMLKEAQRARRSEGLRKIKGNFGLC